jgi:hypothetical protein
MSDKRRLAIFRRPVAPAVRSRRAMLPRLGRERGQAFADRAARPGMNLILEDAPAQDRRVAQCLAVVHGKVTAGRAGPIAKYNAAKEAPVWEQ